VVEDEENEDASHEGYDEDDNVVEEDDMSDDLNWFAFMIAYENFWYVLLKILSNYLCCLCLYTFGMKF